MLVVGYLFRYWKIIWDPSPQKLSTSGVAWVTRQWSGRWVQWQPHKVEGDSINSKQEVDRITPKAVTGAKVSPPSSWWTASTQNQIPE